MLITDGAKAARCLQRIGYYRLSAYWYPFRKSIDKLGPDGRPTTRIIDEFKPDAIFADAVDMYVFDKKLRLLILDAAERVEVALRVAIALQLGQRDPCAHRDPQQVHSRFVKAAASKSHAAWLVRHDEVEDKSKEEFVAHFRRKYSGRMPLWMAIELWDFGLLSFFLSGMKDIDVSVIARDFALPKRDLLKSWVRSIAYARNVCAHHNRLWNRAIVDQPQVPKIGDVPGLDHFCTDTHAQRRLYAVAVALRWLLRRVNPESTWPQRLKAHFETFPESAHYSLRQTGFPSHWAALPFWATP